MVYDKMSEPLFSVPDAGTLRRRTGVCLNMIVKDETPVIGRLLRSVRAAVDYFVIVDTGSRDGTPHLIQRLASELGLAGELHHRDWVDFGHNRQQALELALAANRGDWLLFIDADEELVCPDPDFFRHLEAGVTYLLEKHHGKMRYRLPNLVDVRHNRWRWRGPVHECLECLAGNGRQVHSNQAWILYHPDQGARSRGGDNKAKYRRDAALLEAALRQDPDDARNRFYLAQSYRDAGELKLALTHYERRSQLPSRDEETYLAWIEKARIAMLLGLDRAKIVQDLLHANQLRPNRAEALWLLAHCFRSQGLYAAAYDCAQAGLRLPYPDDVLMVNKAVYDWGLLEELAYSALALGLYAEARSAFQRILADGALPVEHRERARAFLDGIRQAEASHLGTRRVLDGVPSPAKSLC